MKQSYHFYRRRVRLIEQAIWHTFWDKVHTNHELRMDVAFDEADARGTRLLAQARRNFEASRRKGA